MCEVKGTDAILAAVDALKAEGHDVEFVLIEKIPHDKVRAIYASADILIDQVHVGWYGGLAVELMALGKPVVAYIRRDDLQFIPRAMAEELPVVSADPATLRNVLRPLVSDAGSGRNWAFAPAGSLRTGIIRPTWPDSRLPRIAAP